MQNGHAAVVIQPVTASVHQPSKYLQSQASQDAVTFSKEIPFFPKQFWH